MNTCHYAVYRSTGLPSMHKYVEYCILQLYIWRIADVLPWTDGLTSRYFTG